MSLQLKPLNGFRTVSIVSAKDGMGESRIVEDLNFTPWFTIPFGGALFTWIPSYAKFFKSFNPPELPIKDFRYYDEREDLYHVTLFSRLFPFMRSDSAHLDVSETFQDDSELFVFEEEDPEEGGGSASNSADPGAYTVGDGTGYADVF